MARISVFVDGFNLYHSLVNDRFPALGKYLWLDISKLIGFFINKKRHDVRILYFTSLAEWSPGKTERHKVFIRALESTGVETIYGKFKLVERVCRHCKQKYQTYEEKRTDVHIAINLFQRAEKEYDQAVILSGDSDLIPAVEAVKKAYPNKKVGLIIPINGIAEELKSHCNWHSQITQKQLQDSQFPETIQISPAEIIARPDLWT
jgi:uncharacterized LabA/DUF88 family protein